MGWNLAMQENIDEAQLSRAYSYDALGSFVAMPVGQLVYGPLGDRFGYAPVVALERRRLRPRRARRAALPVGAHPAARSPRPASMPPRAGRAGPRGRSR